MKKDAVVKLNRILQETTGVSLFQFDKEPIHVQMKSFIRFPDYAYKTILLPVAILLCLVIVGAIALCLFGLYAFAAAFLILGSLLGLVGGLSIGMLLFVSKWTEELKEMLVTVLKQVKFVLMEISIADEDYLETYLEIPPLEDVIRGMSQIICLSAIEKQSYKHLTYFPEIIFRTMQGIYHSLLDEVANRVVVFPSESQIDHPGQASNQINLHLTYSSQGLRLLDTLIRDKNELIRRGRYGIMLSIKLIGGFTCAFLGLLISIIYLLII